MAIIYQPKDIEGEGKPCPECHQIRPNNTPFACASCDAAWRQAVRKEQDRKKILAGR